MANEIDATIGIAVSKGSLVIARTTRTIHIDMAGSQHVAATQSIGFAAHEIINIPAEIATAGMCWVKNHDATNFLTLGTDSAGNGSGTFIPLLKLKPGEEALFRLATKQVFAKADTAACILEFRVLED